MRRLIPSAVLLLPLVLVARISPAQARSDASAWNREAAATYLDQRMDLWFEHGEKLQTGAARTTCVSCHTVIPYALARPALRRAMHVDELMPQEARLVDETSRRVQASDPKQLLFESDEGQSNGTEAVLYALILASADAAQTVREPSDVTRRAFARMWQTQRDDGAWDWLDVGLEPFESIDSAYQGAAFAALAVGLAPTRSAGPEARGVGRLRAYLREHHASQNLHNRIWGLLASTALPQLLSPSEVEALVGELQRRQGKDGGWSLNGLGGWRWDRTAAPFQSPGQRDQELAAQSDGYATGLIVYTLRQAGVSGEHAMIKSGRQWLRAHQEPIRIGDHEWLAWRAYSLNYDREHGGARGGPWQRLFMSDAATAFATLGLLATD